MQYSKVIQYLLENACPSIRYRTRKELLHEDVNSSHMQELQKMILNEPEVKRILSLSKDDGWLGRYVPWG